MRALLLLIALLPITATAETGFPVVSHIRQHIELPAETPEWAGVTLRVTLTPDGRVETLSITHSNDARYTTAILRAVFSAEPVPMNGLPVGKPIDLKFYPYGPTFKRSQARDFQQD